VAQLVRISVAGASVAGASTQVDLGVAGNVRLADLLPDLAAAAGYGVPLDRTLRLVSSTGKSFREELTLTAQGVRDGQVLALVVDDHQPPPRFDDPAEEMAAAVAEACLPWHRTLARPAALAVGVLALAVGVAALVVGGRPWCGAAGFSVASGLVLAAAALDRRRHEGTVALLAGWAGIAYAAAGGQLLGGVAFAGASAAVVGAVLLRVLTDRWLMVLPAVAAGGVVGGLGILGEHTSLDTGFLAAVALAGTVVLAPGIPRLALTIAESGLVPGARDLAATVASGHDILRALQATAGLLALVLTPAVVRIGWAGALLTATAALLPIVRARHLHSAAEVLIGLGFGVSGLAVAAASVLLFWPAWAAWLGVGSALIGMLVPVHVLSGRIGSPRMTLALDQAESLLLVALLPLLVVSAGVLDVVRGLSSR
jgi:hypothetical protein